MLARLSTASEAPPAAREEREPDVLDLTEAMATSPAPNGSGFRTIASEPDVVFEEPRAERQPAAPGPAPVRAAETRSPIEAEAQLISARTSAAIDFGL